MAGPSARQNALVAAKVFGLAPCILGAGIGLYLRWGGTVWLTGAGGFWPIVFLGISSALLIKRVVSPFSDRVAAVSAWLVIAWTWVHFPLWLTAPDIPNASAVISKQGRVSIVGEWARQPTDTVLLLTGKAGTKIVQNVTGTLVVNSVDVRYRYDEAYVAARSDNEDLARPVISAATAILAEEAGKPRSSRIALFDAREAYSRLLDRICRAAVPASTTCPLKLILAPQSDATTRGSVWSKTYTEKEALDEQHLPTLIQLLTQENSPLVDQEQVFARFMELAVGIEHFSKVARKARMLSEKQFDDLIKRVVICPEGGDEAVSILVEVGRLKQDQRLSLRAKVLREARLELILKHIVPLRIADGEVAELAVRVRAALPTDPGIAALALEHLGQRLPPQIQHAAVTAIIDAKVSHAIAAFEHLNFSETLREELFVKMLADASVDDFEVARISRDKLEGMLTQEEMRRLIASVVKRSGSSAKWLEFAVRKLPVRLMTAAERREVVDGLLFASYKSAMEFVSENRLFLEAADVSEITRDYTRTIAPDVCLHLSHRNTNRKADYFSDTQLQIFRDCAQSK